MAPEPYSWCRCSACKPTNRKVRMVLMDVAGHGLTTDHPQGARVQLEIAKEILECYQVDCTIDHGEPLDTSIYPKGRRLTRRRPGYPATVRQMNGDIFLELQPFSAVPTIFVVPCDIYQPGCASAEYISHGYSTVWSTLTSTTNALVDIAATMIHDSISLCRNPKCCGDGDGDTLLLCACCMRRLEREGGLDARRATLELSEVFSRRLPERVADLGTLAEWLVELPGAGSPVVCVCGKCDVALRKMELVVVDVVDLCQPDDHPDDLRERMLDVCAVMRCFDVECRIVDRERFDVPDHPFDITRASHEHEDADFRQLNAAVFLDLHPVEIPTVFVVACELFTPGARASYTRQEIRGYAVVVDVMGSDSDLDADGEPLYPGVLLSHALCRTFDCMALCRNTECAEEGWLVPCVCCLNRMSHAGVVTPKVIARLRAMLTVRFPDRLQDLKRLDDWTAGRTGGLVFCDAVDDDAVDDDAIDKPSSPAPEPSPEPTDAQPADPQPEDSSDDDADDARESTEPLDPAEHLGELTRTLARHHADLEAWYALGNLGGGEVADVAYDARRCFRKVLKRNRAHDAAWFRFGAAGGGAISRGGAPCSVVECYQRALEIDPSQPRYWSGLADECGPGRVRPSPTLRLQIYCQYSHAHGSKNADNLFGAGTPQRTVYESQREKMLENEPIDGPAPREHEDDKLAYATLDLGDLPGMWRWRDTPGSQLKNVWIGRAPVDDAPDARVAVTMGKFEEYALYSKKWKEKVMLRGLDANRKAVYFRLVHFLDYATGKDDGRFDLQENGLFARDVAGREAGTVSRWIKWTSGPPLSPRPTDEQAERRLRSLLDSTGCFSGAPVACSESARSVVVGGTPYTAQQARIKAVTLDPESAEAWWALGRCSVGITEGVWAERACYERALSIEPARSAPWHRLGRLGGGVVAGRHFRATECLEKSLELDASAIEPWIDLGRSGGGVVCGVRRTPRACFQLAAELSRPPAADAHWLASWSALGDAGGGLVCGVRYREKECYELALQVETAHADASLGARTWCALARLGGGVVGIERYTAKRCCEHALQVDPECAEARERLEEMRAEWLANDSAERSQDRPWKRPRHEPTHV